MRLDYLRECIADQQYTKADLMAWAFGKTYQGIDSALPQDYVDENGLAYGHADYKKDLSLLCTDCRSWPYTIVHLLDDMPIVIASAIVVRAEIRRKCESLTGPAFYAMAAHYKEVGKLLHD